MKHFIDKVNTSGITKRGKKMKNNQADCYEKTLSYLSYSLRRFVQTIDRENKSYMGSPSKGTRGGFMSDMEQRDHLVRLAYSIQDQKEGMR